MKHGTVNTYNNRGCRCDLCKAAKRQHRIQRLPAPGEQPTKKFHVCYGSARLRLNAEPLIELITAKTELNANMRARFRDWRENGVDVYKADEWCIKMNTHPYLVFGDAFYEGCPL